MNSKIAEMGLEVPRAESIGIASSRSSSRFGLGAMAAIAIASSFTAKAEHSAAPPLSVPVSFPSDLMRASVSSLTDLAQTRPIAAAAIVSIIQDKDSPLASRTYRNSIVLTGVPTLDTVKQMLGHADAGAVLGSMQQLMLNPYALEDGPFLMIWWDEDVLSDGETLLRISAELVDGAGYSYQPREPAEPDTAVILRKSDAGLLTLAR